MTQQIPLTKGKFALVDDEDYSSLVAMGKWCADFSGCEWRAQRTIWRAPRRIKLYMHRILLNAPDGVEVDHINGDSLDNRRCNLRLCSPTENQRNRSLASNNSSGYKGVYWDPHRNRWIARIKVNGTRKHLGRFMSAEDAARAYDQAALRYYGEFAKTNLRE